MNKGFDRRTDVGYKATVGVLTSVIVLLLGIFLNSINSAATEAKNQVIDQGKKVTEHDVKLAKFEECMVQVKDDLKEIKDLLKRSSPYEREGRNIKDNRI